MDKEINLGQGVELASRNLNYGVFTNSIALDMAYIINISIEDVTNFVIPG